MKIIVVILFSCVLVLTLASCSQDSDPWASRYEDISSQRDQAIDDKDTWLGIAAFSAGIAGMLLFVGAGLGSSAKNKAGKHDE